MSENNITGVYDFCFVWEKWETKHGAKEGREGKRGGNTLCGKQTVTKCRVNTYQTLNFGQQKAGTQTL
jgi:hypothetical protein